MADMKTKLAMLQKIMDTVKNTPESTHPEIINRELQDQWMQFRGLMGYQQPTIPDSGALAPLDTADPNQAQFNSEQTAKAK